MLVEWQQIIHRADFQAHTARVRSFTLSAVGSDYLWHWLVRNIDSSSTVKTGRERSLSGALAAAEAAVYQLVRGREMA